MSCTGSDRRPPCNDCCSFGATTIGGKVTSYQSWWTVANSPVAGAPTHLTLIETDNITPSDSRTTAINHSDDSISFSCVGEFLTWNSGNRTNTSSSLYTKTLLITDAYNKLSALSPSTGSTSSGGSSVGTTVEDVREPGHTGVSPADSIYVTSDSCGDDSSGTSIEWGTYGHANAQKGKYKWKITHPEWCSGDGSLLVKWREQTIVGTASATYVDKEEEITPTVNTTSSLGTYFYEISSPSTDTGSVTVVGPQCSASAYIQLERVGNHMTKQGWHGYTSTASIQSVYRKQEMVGYIPECVTESYYATDFNGWKHYQADTDYLGQQQYYLTATGSFENDEFVIPEWWNNEWTEPPALINGHYEYPTRGTYDVGYYNFPWRLSGSQTNTLKTVVVDIPNICGSDVVVTTELSDEFTTAELVDAVDAVLLFPFGSGSSYTEFFDAGTYLDPTEHYYVSQKCRWKVVGELPNPSPTDQTLNFYAIITSTNPDTGMFVATSSIEVPIYFAKGKTSASSSWDTINAPAYNMFYRVRVDDTRYPTNLHMCTGGPTITIV